MMVWPTVLAEPVQQGIGISEIFGLVSISEVKPLPRRKTTVQIPIRRTMSLFDVTSFGEQQAIDFLHHLRWPGGAPICPRCDSSNCRVQSVRDTYRCSGAGCYYEFSYKSGTSWHATKLRARDILLLTYLFATCPKGLPAQQLSPWIDRDSKVTHLQLSKIREAINRYWLRQKLSGIVEIDAVFMKFRRRPPNMGRAAVPQVHPGGKCVLSLVQRGGPALGIVVDGETKAEVFKAARRYLTEGTMIMTDEARAYDFLRFFFETHTINHSVEFARGQIFTNNAESFHGRLRRSQRGVYHRIGTSDALQLYISEMAWRHTYARRDPRAQWEDLLDITLSQPPSDIYRGYWDAPREKVSASTSLYFDR